MTLFRASRLVLELVDDRVVPATFAPLFDTLPEPLFGAAVVRHDTVDHADLADRPTYPSTASPPPPRSVPGVARLDPGVLREKVEELRAIRDERILVSPPDRLLVAGSGATPLAPPFAASPGEAPVPFEVVGRHVLMRLRGTPGRLAPEAGDQPEVPVDTPPEVASPQSVQQPAIEAPSPAVAVREQAASTMSVTVTSSGSSAEPEVEATPTVELLNPPAERPTPVEVVEETPVEAPTLDPLFGLLPVDVSAVGREAQALLDHVTALQVTDVADWLGPDKYGWLVGVAAATGGTVQAVRMYRTRGRTAVEAPTTHFVLGRWEGDVGTDR